MRETAERLPVRTAAGDCKCEHTCGEGDAKHTVTIASRNTLVKSRRYRDFVLRIALVLAVLGVAVGSAHAAAPLRHETASSGDIRATVVYRQLDSTHYAMQLTVVKGGKLSYNKPVPMSFGHTGPSQPLGIVGGANTLELGDLDADGVPEVLVNLYTGGAHCCNWTWAYHFSAKTQAWTRTAHVWGDPLYTLSDLSHTNALQLLSADDRFAYAFSAYAGSVLPVQVWVFRNGRFIDETRSFGKVVNQDLATNWHRFSAAPPGTALRPIVAAWAADSCLLGGCAVAYARVQALAPKLNGQADKINGSITSFLAKLKSSLVAWGYWQQ